MILKSNDIEKEIAFLFRGIKKQYKIVFISTFIWGIIAHGMALFNKYSFHDDSTLLFRAGGMYGSGRWMLVMLNNGVSKFFGSAHYSLPLFNGLCSILFIALVSCIFVKLFEIQHIGFCISLSGVMVTIPVITGVFGYMFVAPYYMFGLLLGVMGAFVICRYPKWYLYFGGIFLICCSVGTYQAYIPVVISTFLLYMIKDVFESNGYWLNFLKKGVYFVVACIEFIFLYFLLNEYFLYINHTTLTDYMGISAMGKESIGEYFSRTVSAFRKFLTPPYTYPGNIQYLYWIMFLAMLIFTIKLIYDVFKYNRAKGMQLIFLIVLLPAAINFVYVMSEPDSVHILMLYGQVMIFIYCIWLLERVRFSEIKIVRNIIYILGTTVLLLFSVMYCRFDNACYLKAEFVQEEMISYFTTLVTQIKSTDDYRDDMPVAFVNACNIQDLSIVDIKEFSDIEILPYGKGMKTDVNDYAWLAFIKNWCGYSPKVVDAEPFSDLPEVLVMPTYPDEGSIQIVNETVIIKF